jgi:hypothetical protein
VAGYLGWLRSAGEAFRVPFVCLSESDGSLVADLLRGAEVDGVCTVFGSGA